jgi:hypothetical protein
VAAVLRSAERVYTAPGAPLGLHPSAERSGEALPQDELDAVAGLLAGGRVAIKAAHPNDNGSVAACHAIAEALAKQSAALSAEKGVTWAQRLEGVVLEEPQHHQQEDTEEDTEEEDEEVGFGRIVALQHRSSTLSTLQQIY